MLVGIGWALAGPIAFEDWSERIAVPVAGGSDGLHGVALFDPDNDGDLDIWHTNSAWEASYFLVNDGAGAFALGNEDWEIPIGSPKSGVLAVDFDGDGLVDILELGDGSMTNLVTTSARLLWNRGGTFEVAPKEALVDLLPQTQLVAAAADIDGDEDLDLFVGAPGHFRRGRPHGSRLFRNDGGSFTDITEEAGLGEATGGCAALFAHANEDASPDLFMAGCLFGPHTVKHYVNQGDGTFLEVGIEHRLWERGWWMGMATADFDHDNQLDLFVTNIGSDAGYAHALYLRGEQRRWAESSVASGLDSPWYGWGTTAPDFDNDGHDDVLLVGGPRNPNISEYSSPGELFAGDGTGNFEAVPLPVDLTNRSASGVAQGDVDGDGFPDVVIGVGPDPATGEPGYPVLLRNTGVGGSWLTVQLTQDLPNQAAIGALIVGTAPDGTVVRREVRAGSSFGSTETPWPTLGLGDLDAVSVSVRWPDGEWEEFGTFLTRQRVELVRGQEAPGSEVRKPKTKRQEPTGCQVASVPWGWFGVSRRRLKVAGAPATRAVGVPGG